MGILYISEYANLPTTLNAGTAAIAPEPALVDQTPITSSGTSAQSAAFSNQTNLVRLHTDSTGTPAPVCVKFGANPTATTNNKRLAANQTEYFWVTPGHKVAVITATA